MLGRIGAVTTGARSRRGQGEGYIVARAGVAHVHGLQKLGLLHLGLGLGASPLPVLDGDRQGVGDVHVTAGNGWSVRHRTDCLKNLQARSRAGNSHNRQQLRSPVNTVHP